MRTGIAAALLCVSFAAVSQPSAPSPSELDQVQPDKPAQAARVNQSKVSPVVAAALPKNESAGGEPRHESLAEIWIAIGTSVLALITGFLALYTARLWGATKRIAEDAKDSAQKQLRAYVSPSNRGVYGLNGAIPMTVRVQIKNFGSTPAHNVGVSSRLLVREGVVDEEVFELPSSKGGSFGVVHPGESVTTIVTGFGQVLPSDLVSAIAAGEKTLYVCGRIGYRDAFGQDRETAFRYMISGPNLDAVRRADGAHLLAVCNAGNYAT